MTKATQLALRTWVLNFGRIWFPSSRLGYSSGGDLPHVDFFYSLSLSHPLYLFPSSLIFLLPFFLPSSFLPVFLRWVVGSDSVLVHKGLILVHNGSKTDPWAGSIPSQHGLPPSHGPASEENLSLGEGVPEDLMAKPFLKDPSV